MKIINLILQCTIIVLCHVHILYHTHKVYTPHMYGTYVPVHLLTIYMYGTTVLLLAIMALQLYTNVGKSQAIHSNKYSCMRVRW